MRAQGDDSIARRILPYSAHRDP